MRKTKAYLIDSTKKVVTQVEIGGYKDIQKYIDCRMFTTACNLENGDTLFVDDESLIDGKDHEFFMFEDYLSPIAGNGLLIGSTESGEEADCATNILDCAMKVQWLEKI
jgi:hypothetical protein|tara:strand:+ start:672 stop:998 length:327 start_codon:yes stop_codon:yes gene_type:complete